MNKAEGIFVDIEGGDGTGKGTQYELLVNRLIEDGVHVDTYDFPQYGERSAELVELYLNNEFGPATELDPRVSSAFYALDRRSVSDQIAAALDLGKVVVTNRFSASNMAHQGSKLDNSEKRMKFYNWVYGLEHEILSMPFPDLHVILNLSADIAQQRVLKKAKRNYTDNALDGHEADIEYLRKTEAAYLDLVKAFPGKFVIVECSAEDGRERTIEEVHNDIWSEVERIRIK